MSEDWDIDAYRTDYENPDHWELRKKFMMVHKDKFSEDELVCLAQVFANIEFLGCRYPDQTMIRIAELAKGVVEDFREKRKNSLKRTFVAASDAASAKAKGQTNKKSEDVSFKKLKRSMTDDENMHHLKKKKIVGELITKENSSHTGAKIAKYGGVKTFNIKPEKQSLPVSISKQSSENFVLFLTCGNAHPVSEIERSAAINKIETKWDYVDKTENFKVCKFYLNNILIASSSGVNLKDCKEKTALKAISKLRETCFAIKVKSLKISDNVVSTSHLSSEKCIDNGLMDNEKIGEDNIGKKLMKLMGWKGGGLGSKEQGIQIPVSIPLKVQREGLGQSTGETNLTKFKNNARNFIKKWMNSPSDQDLIFSSEFSSEERKEMHLIARQLSLKSRSYGKGENRQLVISRKFEPWEIVEELKKAGKSSDRYELLYPTKETVT